ncbi:MAG TPA: HAD hydrolase family protein [Longimicrobiales bacterium]|nr:HAD hydrolase family protein [Longimicrobiales bacterium]
MPHCLRAVALDYDGTIAEDGMVDRHVLTATAELRRRGWRVILCTGRILAELREVFPGAERHFDAIVAENGAVVALPGRPERALGPPAPLELLDALHSRRIPARAGTVLLATQARHAVPVIREIGRLGLDLQLIRNRAELMLLPSGITKATGLLDALGDVEISRHSTIAFGDAENDAAMLQACEVGVAVANAVDSLRRQADVVLDQADGAAIAEFLLGPVLGDGLDVQPARWQVELGSEEDGTPVTLPASGINVLISGESSGGKSYVAGVLVEQLATMGYSCCVFDCEGDHQALGELRGVVTIGGPEPLPTPAQLARLVRNRFSSVVVDMSLLPYDAKRAYLHSALMELVALRRSTGLPHWIVLEEADQLLQDDVLPAEQPHLAPIGFCLVTHRPGALNPALLPSIHAVIALGGAERYARGIAPETGHVFPDDADLGPGEALLSLVGRLTRFRVAQRMTSHVRHERKYAFAQVPDPRRFYFGSGSGNAVAGNLAEFCDLVRHVPGDVLERHLQSGDFSRWVREVLADDTLGARLRSVERWYRTEASLDIEQLRSAVTAEIESRYQVEDPARTP